MFPVARDGVKHVVRIKTFVFLGTCHPAGHHVSNVLEVSFKALVQSGWYDVCQLHAVRQELTGSQGGQGVWICEVEFKNDAISLPKSHFCVSWYEVPDLRIRHVNRTKEITWGISTNSPQEGVESSLLK